MRVLRFGSFFFSSAAAAVAVLSAAPLPAQQAVITGRVTSERGTALGGVSVTVANTNLRAATTADGSYRLTLPGGMLTGQQVAVTARYIGHRPATVMVTIGPGTKEVNFQLPEDPFRLEEVVVTGTADATVARNLTFAVSKVTAEDLPVPGASALVGIQGKVAGARFIPSSAQPGVDHRCQITPHRMCRAVWVRMSACRRSQSTVPCTGVPTAGRSPSRTCHA